MKRTYRIVVSLFLLAAGARAQEPIPTLDLTKPVLCESQRQQNRTVGEVEGGIIPGAAGGSISVGSLIHGPQPPRLPLDLRLVHIEPQPLIWFESVTYEVELENVGIVPILIPWGTECDVPWDDGPNKVTAWVQLMLDEDPDNTEFALKFLYGMKGDPATMRLVAPGGKVRIRIKGRADTHGTGEDPVAKKVDSHLYWSRTGADQVRSGTGEPQPLSKLILDVRAEFGFLEGFYTGYVYRKSLNIVPLEVTRRPAP